MRRLLRRLLVGAAASRPGKQLIALAVIDRPDLALIPLGWRLRADASLDDAAPWPERLERFEDVAPLVPGYGLLALVFGLAAAKPARWGAA